VLTAGDKIGIYEVVCPLGAGGMGEVYRARDTKLQRDVALKILPETMAQDAQRMARFEREAQVLASLNHPNIAAIYGLEESNTIRALVMELVEGETLGERISGAAVSSHPGGFSKTVAAVSSPSARSGELTSPHGGVKPPLQIDDALPIAKQIAEALEYAHERGVIHRDLKPANVKITPEGTVKVLDFGLAKVLDAQDSSVTMDMANSPTISAMATQAGVILGTAAYMSPEQAKGQRVDRRADIWAFGCVLYEMLTGGKPFEGETISDVLAAVIMKDPDWAAIPQTTPQAIKKLVYRCLQKDQRQRLRDIGDARITIEETISGNDSVAAVYDRRPSIQEESGAHRAPLQRTLPWAVVASLVGAVAVLGALLLMHRAQPQERMQFAIPLASDAQSLALSADGQMLAYVAHNDVLGQDMVYFERLGSPTATLLAGTEGASYPFWSPDDSNIGFFANGKLEKVSVAGGIPQVLATASQGRGGSWGSQGVIIYAPDAGGPLWRVNSDGSGARALTDKIFLSGEASHRWPEFLPDGNYFLFWSGAFGTGPASVKDGIYVSSLAAKGKKLILPAEANEGYANKHLYYLDKRMNLISVSFDPDKGKVGADPAVIADRISYEPSVFYSAFAAGGNDTVVYSAGAGAVLSVPTWYNRSGKEVGHIGQPGVIANPTISPDGSHAVVDIADLKTANVDVWIEDLGQGTASRFTFDPSEEAAGVWSRDGRTIAYRTIGVLGSGAIEIRKTSGLESARQVYRTRAQDDIMPNSWTFDDKRILCTYEPAGGGSDLVLVDLASGKIAPFLATKASETNGMISPDGKWVVYASNES
jgi:serine/threonine protein kinase/Tol biopolymer transport system component